MAKQYRYRDDELEMINDDDYGRRNGGIFGNKNNCIYYVSRYDDDDYETIHFCPEK